MFIYKINSEWWLIIASRHYYYNVNTKESQWQLPEHLNFKDLNVDEISILIAKYNGLKIETVDSYTEVENDENDLASQNVVDSHVEESIDDEIVEPFTEKIEVEEKETSGGLDLGYLSSEESDEEEQTKEPQIQSIPEFEEVVAEEEPEESEVDVDVDDLVNDILNNESSDQEDTDSLEQQFIEFLDNHKDEISIYDSYSITEEDLIKELSQLPVFYGLSFAQRETIYNKWCTPATKKTYPTDKQLLMNYLFDHKKDIKTKYFVEFKSQLNEFNVSQKEKVFLTYKNLLKNQTEFEKSYKKDKTVNLKKLKLIEYLKPLLKKKTFEVHGDDDWEKWTNLCNDIDISREIAENEVNWLVGPTKRLECYLECLS